MKCGINGIWKWNMSGRRGVSRWSERCPRTDGRPPALHQPPCTSRPTWCHTHSWRRATGALAVPSLARCRIDDTWLLRFLRQYSSYHLSRLSNQYHNTCRYILLCLHIFGSIWTNQNNHTYYRLNLTSDFTSRRLWLSHQTIIRWSNWCDNLLCLPSPCWNVFHSRFFWIHGLTHWTPDVGTRTTTCLDCFSLSS